MSRLDRAGIIAALTDRLPASTDPGGEADLIADRGRIAVAATPGDIGPAVNRLRPLEGYRWLAINGADLFLASPKTIGTKIGILDPTGRMLKAADLPRKK